MSVEAGVTTIAICMIIIVAGGFLALVAAAWAIFALKNTVNSKVDEAMEKIQPLIHQAEAIAAQARLTAESVSTKVDAIAAKAEATAVTVGDRVEAVSNKVEEAINPQVVAAAGFVGTVAKCVQIYRDLVQARQVATSHATHATHAGHEHPTA